MRAVLIPDLSEMKNLSEIEIDGDSYHHLVKVSRVEVGEEILLLDGYGAKAKAVISTLEKRRAFISILEFEITQRPEGFDLVIARTKKDSLDLILKMAVELAFNHIFIVDSEYSQRYIYSEDRVMKLLESALLQSNHLFFPKVIQKDFQTWLEDYQKPLYIMDNNLIEKEEKRHFGFGALCIGPEGGWSQKERDLFEQRIDSCSIIHLQGPILRSSTAVCVGAGLLMAQLK